MSLTLTRVFTWLLNLRLFSTKNLPLFTYYYALFEGEKLLLYMPRFHRRYKNLIKMFFSSREQVQVVYCVGPSWFTTRLWTQYLGFLNKITVQKSYVEPFWELCLAKFWNFQGNFLRRQTHKNLLQRVRNLKMSYEAFEKDHRYLDNLTLVGSKV